MTLTGKRAQSSYFKITVLKLAASKLYTYPKKRKLIDNANFRGKT